MTKLPDSNSQATSINFMMPLKGKTATKTFEFDPESAQWKLSKSYKAGKKFKGFRCKANSINDVYELLLENQEHPCFMIHGGFIESDDIDLSCMIRRKRKDSKDNLKPTICDRMISCFCFDVDGYNGESVEDFIINELPPQFHKASYIYQFSSSYKLTSDLLKVHIFFWLENPAFNVDIREWIKSYNDKKGWGNIIDDSVLVATQPVYTQRRICVGKDDPIQEDNFIGLVEKDGSLKWSPGDAYKIQGYKKHNLSDLAIPTKQNIFDFDIAVATKEIISGKKFHENVRSMALSLMNDRMSEKKVLNTIKGIMLSIPEKDHNARWSERFSDIDRLVESAADIVNEPSFDDAVKWIQSNQEVVVQEQFTEKLLAFDPIHQEQLLQEVQDKLQVGRRSINSVMKVAKEENLEKQKEIARKIESEQRLARGLVEIEVSTNNHGSVLQQSAQIMAASSKKPWVYKMGSTIVRITEAQPKTVRQVIEKAELGEDYPKMPVVQDISKQLAITRGIVEKDIVYLNEAGKGILCPDSILKAIPSTDANWRPLTGVVEHPFITLDFKLSQKKGYDPDTGLYSSLHKKLSLIRMTPSVAYKYLINNVFAEFPFDTKLDQAVAVGALLTAVQRPIIAGDTGMPGFAMVSPKPSSGKTTLVQLISHAVYNRPAAATGWSDNDEEMGKHLLAILREGHSTVLFDNIPMGDAVKSNELAKAMTSSTYSRRKLGDNETETVPANVLWLFTGNNILFKGDFATRILPCRIVPNMERPEQRCFNRGDIGKWAADNRKKILSAALSIIISGSSVDSSKVSCTTQSRFKEWDRMVRLPILNISGIDLLDKFTENSFEDDGHFAKISLLEALHNEFENKSFKTKDIITTVSGYGEAGKMDSDGSDLADAIEELFGEKALSNLMTLGRHLLSLKDNVVGNMKLVRISKIRGTNWRVKINVDGTEDDINSENNP